RPARRSLGVRGARSSRRLSWLPSALPSPWFFLARLPPPLGPRRLPGRRHGTGQDDPDPRPDPARMGVAPGPTSQADLADLPDVGRRQLAQRGRAVHARAPRDGPPRPGARPRGRLQEASRETRSSPVELLTLAPRLRPVEAGPLDRRGPGRGAEYQEPADQA